jgi:hypothetical protein
MYLVLAGCWRIAVELVDNDGVIDIVHPHIFKTYPADITITSLQHIKDVSRGF